MAQTATKVKTEVQVFDKQYINGEWVASTNGAKSIEVIDSNTAEVIATVPDGSAEDTNIAVAAARDAFPAWRDTPLSERKALIEKVAANYEKKKPQIVEALMKELGCTKDFAESTQVSKAPSWPRSWANFSLL
jgi:aldehyde dehydrogenase (NAD+)